MGAANVGPEFTIFEYEALEELCENEDDLYKENKIACRSNYKKILEEAVIKSGRWKKWLNGDEKDFDSLNRQRRQWIIKTRAVTCGQNQRSGVHSISYIEI